MATLSGDMYSPTKEFLLSNIPTRHCLFSPTRLSSGASSVSPYLPLSFVYVSVFLLTPPVVTRKRFLSVPYKPFRYASHFLFVVFCRVFSSFFPI